ncbi:MAG: DUF2071 domain-containing protein [Bacteroidetes bacterium]|nr:DUF2071 domain-containing protein [Bacteroidota bacterium]
MDIPIKYFGELHQIKLINFTIDMDEVIRKVPEPLKIRSFNGRAMISMVDVHLKKMRPSFLPEALSFEYRHVAFRLLIDDSQYNDGPMKGIYFLQSFTDKPLIVFGGGLLTNYNLETATFKQEKECFRLQGMNHCLEYQLNAEKHKDLPKLKQSIAAIDRAYAVADGKVKVTQIQREKWPIQEVSCSRFETDFFKSARFEGAFEVKEVIHYQWLPPQNVK